MQVLKKKYMFKLRIYHLPVLIAAVLILALCMAFSGCYTLNQGAAMISYLNKAVPLEEVDDEQFVLLVTDIRSFAVEYLGLAQSRNYTRYVEIDRSYLAAVVSASAKDSFYRYEWSFPVVGRMPYKGFFSPEDAHKERVKLEKKGLDVMIRPVEAFSTLGWFSDPLYSYMRDYSPARLANLIIHELVHSTVFIKGQSDFNEEFAEFIGTEGSKLFIESRYGIDSAQYSEMLAYETDSKNFIAFIQELICELEILYSGSQTRVEKLSEKARIINASKERFDAEYNIRFKSDEYRGISELPINNAFLDLYRLYYTDDNFYVNLYEASGRDLPAFIAAAKTIKRKGEPRAQLEKALLQ